ncbi:hypothetical protein [Actinoplanes sp. NPDC048796]|uniref:hypothetical protein n=1 Tax=unclassified Actinoplanes TaxID=2626549 RepID=UPI0033C6AA26
MTRRPDLNERLSGLLAESAASLRPRPVDAVVRRGRQRRSRRRAAVAGALTVLALAGGAARLMSGPAEPPPEPPAAPASQLPGVFDGRTPVTLTVVAPAGTVMAGYDDDDRVLVSGTEGKDPELRDRWLVVPDGALRLAVKRPGGWVCASREDGGVLRLRVCRTGAAAQRFTLTTAGDRTYSLVWGGSPVRIGDGGALVAGGTGNPVAFTVAPA